MAEIRITKENFQQEVMESKLPVVIDFWASWCGPCRMLGPVVSQLAEAYEGKLKVGKVNLDVEGELAAQFSVMSIPLVVLMQDGKLVKSSLGYKSLEALKAELGI